MVEEMLNKVIKGQPIFPPEPPPPIKDEYQRGRLGYINDIPIIDLVDFYEHFDRTIEYLHTNVLYTISELPTSEEELNEYQQLKDLYNTEYDANCTCTESICDSHPSCLHGGNYEVFVGPDGEKELILSEKRPCRDLLYECCDNCKCFPLCKNRLVQYGPRKDLRITEVAYMEKQKGLITLKNIPKGAFICEYAGEIVTKAEAMRRAAETREKGQMNYIVCLNESPLNSKGDGDRTQTFVDPSRRGNIGRYLNHSCDPNCEVLSVRVGGPMPRLAIFAKREVIPTEELCFHYGGEQKPELETASGGCDDSDKSDRVPCLCQSENCEKFLPNLNF